MLTKNAPAISKLERVCSSWNRGKGIKDKAAIYGYREIISCLRLGASTYETKSRLTYEINYFEGLRRKHMADRKRSGYKHPTPYEKYLDGVVSAYREAQAIL